MDFFRKFLLFLVGFAALYLAAKFLLGPILPDHIQICKEPAESSLQNCPTYDLIPAIVAYVEAHEGFITALSTIVIAAFTGTLWYSTHRLSEVTRAAFIADKRALVVASGLSPFHSFDQATNSFTWRYRPILENSSDGTPKQLSMYVDCEVRNSPLPKKYSFPDDLNNLGFGVLPPRSKNLGGLAPRGSPVTAQDIADAQAGKKYIYFWGWIKYSSGIKRVDPHITRYCWLLVPMGNPFAYNPQAIGAAPEPGVLTFDISYHTEGNCMDDECKF